jgi:hypothetical protein
MVRGDHFRGAIVVVATLCLLGIVSPLSAAPVSYELRLSENAYVTVDPTNASVLQQAGNVSQHELFSMRDMPYLQLINTSFGTPGAEITRFSLTIGDLMNNLHHFDWAKVIDVSPGMTWQFVMPDAVNGNVRSDAIDIVFTGFTAGKLIRIQTDIDNDQGNVDIFTDFRQVLFDLGGSSDADNAKATASFSAPGFLPGSFGLNLPEFAQLGPTNLGFRLLSECGPESVQPYVAQTVGQLIPEPGTIGLLACGLMVFGCVAHRRRAARNS